MVIGDPKFQSEVMLFAISSPNIADPTSSHTRLFPTSVVIAFREVMAHGDLNSRPPTSNVIDTVDLVVSFSQHYSATRSRVQYGTSESSVV